MPNRTWPASRFVATLLQVCAWIIAVVGIVIVGIFLLLTLIAIAGTAATTTGQGANPLGIASGLFLFIVALGALAGFAIPFAVLLAAAEHIKLLVAIEENTRISAFSQRPFGASVPPLMYPPGPIAPGGMRHP